jgi:hypothetical protein
MLYLFKFGIPFIITVIISCFVKLSKYQKFIIFGFIYSVPFFILGYFTKTENYKYLSEEKILSIINIDFYYLLPFIILFPILFTIEIFKQIITTYIYKD